MAVHHLPAPEPPTIEQLLRSIVHDELVAVLDGWQPADLPLAMNVEEVADTLRMSARTVDRLIHSGTLPTLAGTSRVLIPRRAVETYVNGAT